MSQPLNTEFNKVGYICPQRYACLRTLYPKWITFLIMDYLRERPEEVIKATQSHFEAAQKEYYSLTGRVEYPLLCGLTGSRSYNDLVRAHFRSKASSYYSYQLLDVGAGDPLFGESLQKELQLTVHNISASDMRQGFLTPDERYHICNASDISSHTTITSCDWDCIVFASVHLIDNLKVFCDFYALLKPGGMLIMSPFSLFGVNGQVTTLFEHLHKSGYAFFTVLEKRAKHNERGHIPTLVCYKTHAFLDFSLLYDTTKPLRQLRTLLHSVYAVDPLSFPPLSKEARDSLLKQTEEEPFVTKLNLRDKKEFDVIAPPKDSPLMSLLIEAGVWDRLKLN